MVTTSLSSLRPLTAPSCVAGLAAVLMMGFSGPASAQTELTFATTLPEANPLVVEVFAPWVEALNEAAAGEFVVRIENGPTLANAANVYDRTVSGITDMGWGILGSVNAPFPRSFVSALPFIVEESGSGSRALWSIFNSGLLAEDFGNVHMVSLVVTPPSGLHSTAPLQTQADLAGKKIRTADRISSTLVSAFDATPISVPAPEMYQGLETGLVDAIMTGWPGVVLFRLEEVSTEHLDVALGAIPAGIFMNQQSFEGLSDAGRQILSTAGDRLVEDLGAWYDDVNSAYRARVEAMDGHTVRELDAAELASWRERGQAAVDQWVAETPGGQQILDAFVAALDSAQ